MKLRSFSFTALAALAGAIASAQTNTIDSISIGTAVTSGGTATGVAVVTPLIGTAGNQGGSVLNNLAGIQYVPGQIPLNGAPASIAFFTLAGGAIAGGSANPAADFTSYGTLTSPTAVTTYADPASKLTANSYSGLTFAAANLGFGSSNFYMIHHTASTDYLAEIVPGTGTATLIADLKPMSWTGPTAGGPASVGSAGYFGIAWATGILSAGAPYADQSIYYLRNSTSNHTIFGVMIPALTGASSDTLDLTTAVGAFGASGYTTLAFSPSTIGTYGANQFYYLRQDSITGNTILGWLNPSLIAGTRTVSDIANLGGVFNSLTFASDATGPAGAWGSSQFYASGSRAAGGQSVSFAAIPNHNVGDVFTVTPTASSGLDIDLTVVSGPATVQQTGTSGATPLSLRVFTVTTTGPGIVTLQARQAGRSAAPAFTANLLQQSFNVVGAPIITNTPLTAAGTSGAAFSFTITALGSPTSYSASPLPPGLSLAPSTGIISGTPTATGTTNVLLGATNGIGTGNATLVVTVAAAGAAPVITNLPLTAAGTVGTPFSFTITASGSPTSYTASPLPAGLAIVAATGAITGTPTAIGTTFVQLGATNSSGTGVSTLSVTVAAAGIAPLITNSPLTAAGTVGVPFGFTIVASGTPTTYTASPLPAGLSIVAATGVITGTPTGTGTTVVALGATNSTGTGSANLTITVAAAGVAPIITNTPLTAAGYVGVPFGFTVTASGLPTTYTASPLPSGLTVVSATGVIAGTPTSTGTTVVTLGAANTTGTGNATLTVTIGAAPTAPVIATQPPNQTVTVGGSVTFTAGASGTPTPTYQWFDNGIAIPGATGATYTLNNVQGGSTGSYTVTITNIAGTVTSNPASLTVNFSHIVNFSVRAQTGPGNQVETLGFVTSGTKTLLLRGVGPALTAFGVPNAMPDPQLTLFSGNTVLTSDTGWQTAPANPAIAGLSAQFGAFPLAAGSLDSALIATLAGGPYTMQVVSSNNVATGAALAEVYDADLNLGAKLINASARMRVNGGNVNNATPVMIGFVIQGTGSKTVLIRGVGPGLSLFGVTGVLPDPQINVFAGTTLLATNTGWGTGTNTTLVSTSSAQIGAFPLAAGSGDSALVLTLQPGTYTVQLLSAGNNSGTGLLEVWDVQ